ncbi:MAG: glycosyltransferase family 9 protein [Sphingobacteriales bacterium]|nr:MAG: glycosyltransferase family 9 protein [Sphingobacteriales bacterium]
MNTNRQILLDNTIIKWFAWLLNILVVLAGKVAPKNHDLSLDFKTIAICKFKGLGSIIQATPLLLTLRNAYPDARIIFISSASNKSLLGQIDIIDEVIILEDGSFGALIRGVIPFIQRLFRLKIDVYIDLEVYSNFSTVVAALSNATNRFGYYLKESNYRMGIYTHMMYYNSSVAIFQTYLQWARLLACREVVMSLYPFTNVIAANDPSNSEAEPEYIVINPNASDLRIERRWPEMQFVHLIGDIIRLRPGLKICLIGGPGERDYVTSIERKVNNPAVKNLAGTTSIPELIRLINGACMVITNDTGPMHLAFALRKPTVALFGPCSPAQYGDHSNAVIIYKNVYCSPCVHEFRIPPCGGNNQCMKQISRVEVLSVVAEIFSGNSPAGSKLSQEHIYRAEDEVLGIIRRSSY